MYLDKFVHSNTGRVIMSIILGIGLATFFRAVCKGKKCRIIAAPPIEDIEDQTYKFDNKCYTFEKVPMNCTNNKKTVKIA
jgi:hypothetical protein